MKINEESMFDSIMQVADTCTTYETGLYAKLISAHLRDELEFEWKSLSAEDKEATMSLMDKGIIDLHFSNGKFRVEV